MAFWDGLGGENGFSLDDILGGAKETIGYVDKGLDIINDAKEAFEGLGGDRTTKGVPAPDIRPPNSGVKGESNTGLLLIVGVIALLVLSK